MEKKQVCVVGGGPAGCAAALEAARLGLDVTLIDEHPQSLAAMSLDTPYFYGSGLPSVLANRRLAAEMALTSNGMLMECVESGVDVITSTCVWGSYRAGENSSHFPLAQLGLADEERSWMVAYDHLIIAAGARDLVIPFPDWELPGVVGACGASALLDRYKVFEGNGIVVLGSNNLALRTAQSARRAGLEVKAVVEVASDIQGDAAVAAELRANGVAFYLSHTVLRAVGKTKVEAVRVAPVGDGFAPISGAEIDIVCDAICMAFGAVPNIELAAVSGCEIIFDASRGGWAPAVDANLETTQGSVFVVGDGAMISEAMFLDPAIAMAQGRRAAQAIAHRENPAAKDMAGTSLTGSTLYPPWDWHRALVGASGPDVTVCQCESVSRAELLNVSPPKYLQSEIRRPGGRLTGLSGLGRASQDLVKRLTRAGMGHCQGKRCRDHCAMLLAERASCDLSAIRPGSYRTPVRPLSLKVLSADDETEETRRDWRTWVHAADGNPEI